MRENSFCCIRFATFFWWQNIFDFLRYGGIPHEDCSSKLFLYPIFSLPTLYSNRRVPVKNTSPPGPAPNFVLVVRILHRKLISYSFLLMETRGSAVHQPLLGLLRPMANKPLSYRITLQLSTINETSEKLGCALRSFGLANCRSKFRTSDFDLETRVGGYIAI
jgi:hypothetical protein